MAMRFRIQAMRNLIALAVFLLGIGALIFWLWSGTDGNQQDLSTVQTQVERPVARDAALNEVEITVDDNGLVIDRLYGKQLDLLVTRNEVKDVTVLDGIMTFSEREDGKWNFKAVNLEQYIDSYLKK